MAVVLVLGACAHLDDPVSVERSAAEVPTTTTSTTAPTTTKPPPTTTTTTTTAPQTTTTTAPPLGPVKVASSPAESASRIAAAENTIRNPKSQGRAVAAAAFEAQILYRQLARTPEWEQPVLQAVKAPLRPTITANVAARREFRSMHSKLSDTLPAWRIVKPAPADKLLAYYKKGQDTFGVPWQILAAVNLVETGMGRIRGTSVAGAQGPMQFMPATWAAYGEGDINDPHDAIMGAARYLAANGGGAGQIDSALWHYNHSNKYVRGVKHYASIMATDPRAFFGFYHWQVIYLSEAGDVWLPERYEQTERIPVRDYLAANPNHRLGTATN